MKCECCLEDKKKLYRFKDKEKRELFICSQCKKRFYNILIKEGFKLKGPIEIECETKEI